MTNQSALYIYVCPINFIDSSVLFSSHFFSTTIARFVDSSNIHTVLRNNGFIPSSSSNRRNSVSNAGCFEPYLLGVGQAISISEIFLEKLSQTVGGESIRRSAIFGIESTKAVLRLLVLLERQEATMLLRWGVGNNGKVLNLKDY